uniref:Uncharacterized protein n=1 Tax=Timema monikensis TaxID=170555 RepID=A0A7R9E880_9NEOP|nr:unnamed protein product [Timema monikensis]
MYDHIIMAQWGNEFEILSDLDKLSVFTTGQLTKDTLIRRGNKIVTSTSFGRGTVNKRPGKAPKIGNHFHPSSQSSSASSYSSDFEDLALGNEMAFGFTEPPPFSLGRSRLLSYEDNYEDNKIARREAALQTQLRMACGKGYSNELIEHYLMQHQVSSDKEEQFSDCHSSRSASSISNSTSPVKFSPHQSPSPCVPKPAKDLPWERCQVEKQSLDLVYATPSPEPDLEVTNVLLPSPSKKQSSVRSRNVLLNSITNLKINNVIADSMSRDNDIKNTIINKSINSPLLKEDKQSINTRDYFIPPDTERDFYSLKHINKSLEVDSADDYFTNRPRPTNFCPPSLVGIESLGKFPKHSQPNKDFKMDIDDFPPLS